MLLLRISEHRQDRAAEEVAAGGASTGLGTQVNRAIQLVAQRYCGECRSSFEELSKIIQVTIALPPQFCLKLEMQPFQNTIS